MKEAFILTAGMIVSALKSGFNSFYANRHRSFDEILPWDHIDYGVTKDFLIRECKKAYADTTTPHCRLKCNNCGAAKYGKGVCFEKRKNMV